MIPWGAIISLAGTAASAMMSKKNNEKIENEQENEYARQQAYYAAKAAENPLSRSENQHVLRQYDRDAQQQIESARNVAAITGATPEYSLAVQKNIAQGRADLMGDISSGASERADKFNNSLETSRQQQSDARISRMQQRNESFSSLAANAANTFGSLVGSYGSMGGFDEDMYKEKIDNLNKAHERGLIDDDTYTKKQQRYNDRYNRYLKRNIL